MRRYLHIDWIGGIDKENKTNQFCERLDNVKK